MPARTILATLIAATFAGPLQAQESGGFVVRLGRDTTSVERFTRTPKRVEVDQVGRVPKVLKRHFVYDYDAAGAVTRVTVTVTSPTADPGAPVGQQLIATFTPDSVILDVGLDPSGEHVHMGVQAWRVVRAMSGAGGKYSPAA